MSVTRGEKWANWEKQVSFSNERKASLVNVMQPLCPTQAYLLYIHYITTLN